MELRIPDPSREKTLTSQRHSNAGHIAFNVDDFPVPKVLSLAIEWGRPQSDTRSDSYVRCRKTFHLGRGRTLSGLPAARDLSHDLGCERSPRRLRTRII
jgi:hypothetical protein